MIVVVDDLKLSNGTAQFREDLYCSDRLHKNWSPTILYRDVVPGEIFDNVLLNTAPTPDTTLRDSVGFWTAPEISILPWIPPVGMPMNFFLILSEGLRHRR